MTILIDSREGSFRLAKIDPVRSLLPPCPCCAGTGNHPDATPKNPAPCRSTGRQLSHITTLQGQGGPDVLVVGQGPSGPLLIAVEVKEIRELINAADTGRLQAQGEGQLPVMLANYHQNWLLYYGNVRCGEGGYLEEPRGRGDNGRVLWGPFSKNGSHNPKPVLCSYFDSMLIAVARMGVLTHRVANEKEAARWLGVLHDPWTKPWDQHRFTHTFNAAPRFPSTIPGVSAAELERARRVFDRYPGLGMERSLAAARHFPSVQAMANATEKEWIEVPGIGKVIATAVVKGFRA